MADERRRHVRKRVDLTTHYRVAGSDDRIAAHLSDLSLGGAYVDLMEEPPEFGTKVILFVELPSGKELALDGVVRWTKPGGMGLQFGALGAAQTYHLTEYIAEFEPLPDSRFIG